MKQPNFDLIARPYRWLEYLTLGKTLERCRFHFLSQLHDSRHALILGDGDGRFTAELLAANPTIEADAIDISAVMLALLRQRCETIPNAATTRLRTHHSNALAFPYEAATRPYDLVVTHFFLDCFTQPELNQLITRIVPTLAPQALWLVSDFRIPDGPMRLPARGYIRSLYFAFRVLTGLRTTELPEHATQLARSGFTRRAYHHILAGMLTTELWQGPNVTPQLPLASDNLKAQTHGSPAMTQTDNNTKQHPGQPIKTPQPDTHPAPIPDPEPASPSLDEPDPAVFHHTPARPSD